MLNMLNRTLFTNFKPSPPIDRKID
jgi:hypothetical protein